jgi:hypothetical protein
MFVVNKINNIDVVKEQMRGDSIVKNVCETPISTENSWVWW